MCVEIDTSRIQSSIIVFVEAGVASVESNRLKERARRRTSPAWRILPRLDSVRAAPRFGRASASAQELARRHCRRPTLESTYGRPPLCSLDALA
jgi:hypothetical protein